MSLVQSSQGHSAWKGRVEAGGGEPDGTPSGQRDGRSGSPASSLRGQAWVPRQRGRDPTWGDLRVSGRYVEVHRVAEVAAFGSAVHRELVHVQVERLRGGGPQHPQSGREAAEGRERRCPADPGTAAGPGRHRPPAGWCSPGSASRGPRLGNGGRGGGRSGEPRSRVNARDASAVTAPGAPPRVPCGLLGRRIPRLGAGGGDASPPLAAGGGPGALGAPPSGRPAHCGPEPVTHRQSSPPRAAGARRLFQWVGFLLQLYLKNYLSLPLANSSHWLWKQSPSPQKPLRPPLLSVGRGFALVSPKWMM